jgi:hypothetical protein
MAIITTSNFPKMLWPGLNAIYGKTYNEYSTEYTDLFDSFSSKRAYEEDMGVSGFGLAAVKNQGDSITYDTASQAYLTRYKHLTYGLGFIITREAFEDDQYDVVGAKGARALASSIRQTKEVVGAGIYNNAEVAANKGGDGVSLLNASHPSFAGGVAQSNTLNSAFCELTLETAMINISKFTDDRGLLIAAMAQCLIIPPDLEFEAQRTLKTEYRVNNYSGVAKDGAGFNDINALKMMGRIPGGIKVNHYLTNPAAWYLRTNVKDGMKCFNRRADEFAMDNDFDTENGKYKATSRYSFGWSDWRGIYGNVS